MTAFLAVVGQPHVPLTVKQECSSELNRWSAKDAAITLSGLGAATGGEEADPVKAEDCGDPLRGENNASAPFNNNEPLLRRIEKSITPLDNVRAFN